MKSVSHVRYDVGGVETWIPLPDTMTTVTEEESPLRQQRAKRGNMKKPYIGVKICCPITGDAETVYIYQLLDIAVSRGCDSAHGDPRCDHCADKYVREYSEHWPAYPDDPMKY